MHTLEEKIIKLGGIDAEIREIHIDDWFENASIAFTGNENKEITCNLKQCFEISLKHDENYIKGKKLDGSLNYKYFIQDVEIMENGDFYVFQVMKF